MGDTSEKNYGRRSGIGQHRVIGRDGAPNSEQSTRIRPGANVGPNLSGGEMQNAVPPSRRDAYISTTSGSAGPLSPGERRGGADDR